MLAAGTAVAGLPAGQGEERIAHYVTQDLDEGPIIEPDVVRVDHTHSVEDLVRLGADVERAVLSRAVAWHCQDRVMRHGNETVVF